MLGDLAKHREEQVIEWAMENQDATFTAEGVCKELYKDDERFQLPPQEVIEAYAVACRDLRRKQILKGLTRNRETESFTLNDMDTVKSILQKEGYTDADNPDRYR